MNEMNTVSEGKIDGVLQRYFQQEMPQPWPQFAYPRPIARPARKRTLIRLALAACVALLFLGYWSLTQMFPTPETAGQGGIIQERHIGKGVKPDRPIEPRKTDADGGMKIKMPGGL